MGGAARCRALRDGCRLLAASAGERGRAGEMRILTIAVGGLILAAGIAIGAHSQADELHKLFADYYEFKLREDPRMATSVGRADYNDRWDDPSPEHLRVRCAELQKLLDRLHAIPLEQTTGQDRLNWRVMDWSVKNEIKDIDLLSNYFTVNGFVGAHLNIFSTVPKEPAKTGKDYEDQIARLRALPEWVHRTIAAANDSITQKRVPPKQTAEAVVKQLDAEMAPEAMESALLKAFKYFPDSIPASEQARLRAAAIEAYNDSFRPAWKKFRDYVAATYVPASRDSIGLSHAADGPALYAFLVQRRTTTNYSPDEIHEIGLKEVARIQAEMAAVRKELNFSGTAQEFSDQVLNAPRFHFHSEEEILVHGRDIAKRIDPKLPHLFKKLPRMTYGVAAIPADRARTAAPYYEGPALDGSRAGYFYLRTVDPEKASSCCMEALILHESVPGHHLQIALADEIEGMPEFRKVAAGFNAYVEGWALYAETLGAQLHMYETPYERYGQLQSELFRAARLVVDTGIHTKNRTRDQAIDYLYSSGANPSRDFMASETDRYIAWPAQALSYKMGELKIMELRNLAQIELGPKFDIRDFHDAVLRNGALPLDYLEEEIKAWIAQVQKQ
jgi:uncharacterized protein (DUF885 family)